MLKKARTIGVTLVLAAAISGCGSPGAATTGPEGAPPPPTVGISAVATPVPTGAARVSTPAPGGGPPTATLSAPESLTSAELNQRLNPFAGAEGCALPCYNGIVAGTSTLRDVLNFYARLGIGVPDLIPGDYEAAKDGTGHLGAWLNKATDEVQAEQAGQQPPLLDVGVKDDRVQYVDVGWLTMPDYMTPAQVLASMGQPALIDLALTGGDQPEFLLRLLYPAQQVGIVYDGAPQVSGGSWQVCAAPGAVGRTYFRTFAAGTTYAAMADLPHSDALRSLTDTLGLAYDDFAAQMVAGGCLTLSADQAAAWGVGP